MFAEKKCVRCGEFFRPLGPAGKYCSPCGKLSKKEAQTRGQRLYRIKHGVKVGIGSGALGGELHPGFKHGRCVFRKWAKEAKNSYGRCAHCNLDLMELSHYEWVGHHKDHDPTNNTKENLVLLCKRCHQIEHKCWESFNNDRKRGCGSVGIPSSSISVTR